jgi:hypothetical protein
MSSPTKLVIHPLCPNSSVKVICFLFTFDIWLSNAISSLRCLFWLCSWAIALHNSKDIPPHQQVLHPLLVLHMAWIIQGFKKLNCLGIEFEKLLKGSEVTVIIQIHFKLKDSLCKASRQLFLLRGERSLSLLFPSPKHLLIHFRIESTHFQPSCLT